MRGPAPTHPQDLRAAEYALGVLEGAALAEAEALTRSDAAFADAVETWELRLAVLADYVPEVRPPDRVWEAIRLRLSPLAANDNARWWNSIDVWRGLTAASVAVGAIAIGILAAPNPGAVVQPKPPAAFAAAPWTAVVAAPDGGPKLAAITVDNDLKRIVVTPLALTEEQAKSLELWVVPADGSAPRSLGLVKAGGSTVLANVTLPVDAKGAALAISREPTGGSPTGLPTGPILGVGALAVS
ncbi:MAG: anti-sigma factor [Caulobacter sp.]|nr:anti-sigma factor [Caulobacter sp.]